MPLSRLLATLLAVVVLAACTPGAEEPGTEGPTAAPTPQSGGVAHLGIVGEPATLDPYRPSASDHSFALVRPVFPMLYRLQPDGSVEPDLATGLTVRGGIARLRLRRTRWSDATPITARDVVASIRRAQPPSGFARLRSARAVSTRRIHLRGVTGGPEKWQEVLASGAYVLPGGRLRRGGISGGPYRFARYTPGRRLVYERNSAWDRTRPLLDRIVVDFVQSTDLLVRLLAEGKLDAAAIPSTVNLTERLDGLGLDHASALGWETVMLDFDDSLPGTAWIATAFEIDRERLLESFVRDEGRLSNTLAPGPKGTEGFWSHVASDPGPPPAAVTIAAPEGDELLGLMQRAIQLDLEAAGIAVEIMTAPSATYYSRWLGGGPADAYVVRRSGAPGAHVAGDEIDSSALPLAHVETFLAWTDGLHGLAANPSLDGALWNAAQWWKDPSI